MFQWIVKTYWSIACLPLGKNPLSYTQQLSTLKVPCSLCKSLIDMILVVLSENV